MDIWEGQNYRRSTDRILVLCSHWYGEVEPLREYVPRWARDDVTDATFSRLFNALSGFRADSATHAQRLAWWHDIAFYNFVPGTVGKSGAHRPTAAMYIAARDHLPPVLAHLNPRGVWIVGKRQSKYSADLVHDFGAAYEVTNDPRSGVSAAALASSWANLLRKVQGPPA